MPPSRHVLLLPDSRRRTCACSWNCTRIMRFLPVTRHGSHRRTVRPQTLPRAHKLRHPDGCTPCGSDASQRCGPALPSYYHRKTQELAVHNTCKSILSLWRLRSCARPTYTLSAALGCFPEVVGSSGDQTGPYRRRMPADTLQAVALHAMLALLSSSPAAVTYHLWHISAHSPPQMLPC